MSAYGAISRPGRPSKLPSTEWRHPRNPHAIVTLFHIDPSAIVDAGRYPGLFDHLHAVFADEVDKGLTYPQENMRDPDAFRAYFFAADVVIAIVGDGSGATPDPPTEPYGAPPAPVAKEVAVDLETAQAGRPWDACVVGFYYVKPNYPGRSSHVSSSRPQISKTSAAPQKIKVKGIVGVALLNESWTIGQICNAGFVVPPSHRCGGYGHVLARSYLYYAPRLGYKASVFNLVYVNNVASVRLWEKLGFVKAGLIPKAGRLRRMDGLGEEYIDAWVFYKSFEDELGGRA